MKRLIVLLGLAVAAYLVYLQFIFPGYVAAPVPFHNDMYVGLREATTGGNFLLYLRWPRPLFYEALLFAGRFGLEGSLAILTSLVIFDIALVLYVFERLVLKSAEPLPLAFGTMLLIVAGPGFFVQPGFDVGYHIALLFGLLGMLAWGLGTQGRIFWRWLAALVCFILSALAKEAFIPAIVGYGLIAAWKQRRSRATAALTLLLPLAAIAAAAIDGRLTHTPFVTLTATATDPYRIDLSPLSLLQCSVYYLSSVGNAAFLILLAVCLAGAWYKKRLRVALLLLAVGLSLYLPYIVLPNHLDELYRWPPVPLLALLIPLAWIPAPSTRRALAFNAVLGIALAGTIVFQSLQYQIAKNAVRLALAQNRAVIASLRANASELARAQRVLVRGISFESNPWAQNAPAIAGIIPFTGEWWVETVTGTPPIRDQSNAHAIPTDEIDENNYDAELVYDRNGRLTRVSGSRANSAKEWAYFPDGIVAPLDQNEATAEGIYPSQSREHCCFLTDIAYLRLDVPARAHLATFHFWVPDVAPLVNQMEVVTITIDGNAPVRTRLLPGAPSITVSLPPRAAARAVNVRLQMSVSYVPKTLGLNGDTRRLSVFLTRVEYE